MIPSEYRDEVVQSGISFLQAITRAYGPETGSELWDSFTQLLDPDLKQSVFVALLCGEQGNSITLQQYTGNGSDRVAIVRSIREATKLGLKDAMELSSKLMGFGNWDAVQNCYPKYAEPTPVTLKLFNNKKRAELVATFRAENCIVA